MTHNSYHNRCISFPGLTHLRQVKPPVFDARGRADKLCAHDGAAWGSLGGGRERKNHKRAEASSEAHFYVLKVLALELWKVSVDLSELRRPKMGRSALAAALYFGAGFAAATDGQTSTVVAAQLRCQVAMSA